MGSIIYSSKAPTLSNGDSSLLNVLKICRGLTHTVARKGYIHVSANMLVPFTLAALLAASSLAAPEPPVCTDGGTLHCCQASFAGDLPLIEALAGVACYNLVGILQTYVMAAEISFAQTPEDVNCIGSKLDPRRASCSASAD